jgi:hypothetical protein
MHSVAFIQRSVLAISTIVLLSLAGCGDGDNKTCTEACNTLFACSAKLNLSPSDFMGSNYATVDSCIARCNTGSCAKKQQMINCGAGLQCNSLDQVEADVTACFVNSNCSP